METIYVAVAALLLVGFFDGFYRNYSQAFRDLGERFTAQTLSNASVGFVFLIFFNAVCVILTLPIMIPVLLVRWIGSLVGTLVAHILGAGYIKSF